MIRNALVFCLLLAAPTAQAQVLRDDLWVTNGAVNALAIQGNTLYLGGTFSRVGPATGGLVAVHGATAAPVHVNILVDGEVNAILPDGMGGWYLGGTFQNVQGAPRSGLARVTRDGGVLPWNPNVVGIVRTMVQSGNAIHVGGAFVTIGGQARSNLAAVDTATGAPTGWNPPTNGPVNALALLNGLFYVGGDFSSINGIGRTDLAALDGAGTPNGWSPGSDGTVYALAPRYNALSLVTSVFIGGSFGNCGGQNRPNFAIVDATPGSATFGQANAINFSPNGTVNTLQVTGNTLYTVWLGGGFTSIGGQPRAGLASTRGSSVLAWNPGADGTVTTLALYAGNVLVGGSFANLGGQPRLNAGQVTQSTGLATAWNPQPNLPPRAFGADDTTVWMAGDFSSIGGVARGNLAALDLTSGMATSWNPGTNGTVWALESIGGLLYAGGEFTYVTDVPSQYAAQIDAAGNVGSWDPQLNGFVYAIAGRPAVNKNLIYLGGAFTSARGLTRNRLAAVDDLLPAISLLPWDPNVGNGEVRALTLDDNAVYAGGTFASVNSQSIQNLAKLRYGNGAPASWNPIPQTPILGLALQNGMVFAGFAGQTVIGGSTRRGAAALDTTTAQAKLWTPEPVGTVNTLLPNGAGATFLGGEYTNVGSSGISNLAEVDVLPTGVGDPIRSARSPGAGCRSGSMHRRTASTHCASPAGSSTPPASSPGSSASRTRTSRVSTCRRSAWRPMRSPASR